MPFLTSFSEDDQSHFFQVVGQVPDIRSHFDLFMWLGGGLQRFLPHDILVAAWGDFQSGALHIDIISPMTGVRTDDTNVRAAAPLMSDMFQRWQAGQKAPYAIHVGSNGFDLPNGYASSPLGRALQQMQATVVHGITDHRGQYDCIYAIFSKQALQASGRYAVGVLLPYIDSALRQVMHTPADIPDSQPAALAASASARTSGTPMSERERQIMRWVRQGKTNGEIGTILDISAFTVKNHMQRIFKKLDVYNRAQAVSRFKDSTLNG